MWQLIPTAESDSAYHCGADLALLSQFAAEQEVLFPPTTMLVVLREKGSDARPVECAPLPTPRPLPVEEAARYLSGISHGWRGVAPSSSPRAEPSSMQSAARGGLGFEVRHAAERGRSFTEISVCPHFL